MAPDLENGLEAAFFTALEAAVAAGTHLVIARDHTDIGSCLLALDGCLAQSSPRQRICQSELSWDSE